MGFRISWIAAEGMAKADFLKLFDLEDTGKADEANEAPFSCASLPTGRTVLWSNDFEFAGPARLAELSWDRPLLGCRVHEGVMVTTAMCFERGEMRWSLTHIAEEGLGHLLAEEEPPQDYVALRDAALVAQADDDQVDYVSDVPCQVAQQICGFKYDKWRFDWGEPEFTVASKRRHFPGSLLPWRWRWRGR